MKHGHAVDGNESPTYSSWRGMINRCNNPNDPRYKDYGGRGITICESWLDFRGFLKDMGEKPPGMQIDRRDNSMGYCPENCKWSTRVEQQGNMRNNIMVTAHGKTMCLRRWSILSGINYGTLFYRVKRGWSTAEIFKGSTNALD